MRELRLALRSLRRTPVFALAAIVILSLSVGSATAIFNLLYALVLRPLPVPNPHQLVRVTNVDRLGREGDLTWRMYRELGANQRVFSTLIASLDQGVLTIDTEHGSLRGAVSAIDGNFFAELGARPALGRLIQPGDVDFQRASGQPVVVLGWNFWQRHYFGDPSVVGHVLKADGRPLTIIGVAPRDFMGVSVTIDHDLMVPIGLVPSLLDSEATMVHGTQRWINTIGRLAPGQSLASARAHIEAMWPAIRDAATPEKFLHMQRDDYQRLQVRVSSGATGVERGLRARYTQPLYALLGIAGLVLVIAAINLCSLVFARAESRRHELNVRLALGSGRARLLREFAAEGLWLGLAGAIGGVLVAAFASDAITGFLLQDYVVRTALDISPGAATIGAAVSAATGVAVLVSVAAAAIIMRGEARLVPGGGRTIARSSRTGRWLVGVQVAVSILMLSHASLLVRSVYNITATSSGLTRDTVIVGYPSPRLDAYRTLDVGSYYRQALDRVRAVPGVAAAAFSTFKPEGGLLPWEPIGIAGTVRSDTDASAEWPQVSPGFFETLGLTLLRGRDFTFADTEQSAKVAIISRHLEQRLFGGESALGRRIRISARPQWQEAEIVGVVSDARVFDVRRGNLSIAYTPAIQRGPDAHYKCMVVRAPIAATLEIQRAIEGLGVELVPRTQTLEYARGRTILQERLMASLGAGFAGLALVLVATGIYGLMSYVLSLHRKEIGIRLALGAEPARIGTGLLGNGLRVTTVGLAGGLALTLLSVPLLQSVLVNTSPYDPIAIGSAAAVLLLMAALAAAPPALRASRVEPVAELRRD